MIRASATLCTLAALALALPSTPVTGEETLAGRVQGLVADLAGQPVAGAAVKLVSAGSSEQPTRFSDLEGRFSFEAVAPGHYTLLVTKAPVAASVEKEIDVLPSGTLEVAITMESVGVSESVDILAERDPLDPLRIFPGSTVNEQEQEDMPSASRGALETAELTVGAVVENADPQLASRGLSATGVATVRAYGSRPSQSRYLVDGIDQTPVWRAGGRPLLPPEMISQVVVSAVAAPAESTKGPGPALNVVTRSGGNQLHGQVFAFLQDERLDANSWARNRTLADPRSSPAQRQAAGRPPDDRRWLGATLGGPLGGKQTHFFVGVQFFSDSEAFFHDDVRAPTAAMARGDFSAIPNLILIDPVSKRQFTGNQIPASRLDPVAAQLAALIPNVERYGDRSAWSGTDERSSNQAFAKLDHRLGRQHQLTLSYATSWGSTEQADFGGNRNPNWAGYVDRPRQHEASLQHRWLGRRLLLETALAYHSLLSDRDNLSPQNRRLDQMGANWPLAGGDVDYPPPNYLPQLTVAGGMGGILGALDPIRQEAWSGSSALSGTRGHHHWKAGLRAGHGLTEISNRGDQSRLNFDGRYTFGTSASVAAAGENQYAHSFADLLLGRSSSHGVSARLKNDVSDWNWAIFAQDDWRVSRRLSLSLGLRWEYHSAPYQSEGRLSTWAQGHQSDLYPNLPKSMAVDGDGGMPRGLYTPGRFNLAPRLALSFDLSGDTKTILRAGGGLYYAEPPLGQKMFLDQNEPFLRSLTGSGSRSLTDPWASTYPLGPPLPLELTPSAVTYRPGQRINMNAVDPDGLDTPFALQMHAVIERQLFPGGALHFGYVGARGYRYILILDANAPPPTSAGASSSEPEVDSRRPAGAPYRQVRQITPVERPHYDALYVVTELRWRRLSSQLSYLLQRSTSAAGILAGGDTVASPAVVGTTSQDLAYFEGEFDPRHVLRAHLTFQTPPVRSRGWNRLLGGWSFSGLFSWRSGTPLTPRAGRDLNFDGISGPGSDRPNLNGAIVYRKDLTDSRGYQVWFARQSFSPVAAPSASAPYPLGNTQVGAVRGPSWWRLDASLSKQVQISRGVRLVLLLQATNVLNHAPLDNPVMDMSSADFGLITGRSANGRTLRVGLRLQF